MARCYHDTQDFKSDLNIEVAREGDILEAGQDLKDRKCDKNPVHRGFIPFKDLTLEHLPIQDQKIEILYNIKKMGNIVVRLVVDKIKNGRWIKEAGSGCVNKFQNKYVIKTNNHVVKTEDDVKHCTVEFYYDDDSRSNVFTSRGVELVWTCPYRDITMFTFQPVPVHQPDLEDNKLPYIVIMYENNQIETESIQWYYKKSEPKFYYPLNLNSSQINLMFLSWPDGYISYIKSSYFTFQPIPSNRPLFTAIKILFCYRISGIKIEIHIDEDDGNSRVIPGDVVKFGAEFVVKISESIFQDEVKKCRLVYNGDVIGCGTRLYFKQVKSRDIFSGIDLGIHIEQGVEKHWIFEFHPIPTDLQHLHYMLTTKHIVYMCCIGHPHGGIKMVTFGLNFNRSLERFDYQGRHIVQPNSDCQCKEVACATYTCKTCPGSSGSPVFPLYEGMDSTSSYTHFMGERIGGFLPNGERMENINMAWCYQLYRDLILR